MGFCSSNPGLYKKAITDALNFDRTLFAVTYTIRHLTTTVTSLVFGFCIDRFRARKMVIFGLSNLISSVVIFSFANSLPLFYLGGVCWGIGTSFCGGTMSSTIVRRWFDKDIGRYTGIVMSANGVGGAVAAQIITPLIHDGTVFGYRNAYRLSAVLSLLVSIAVVSLLKDRPAQSVSTDTKKKQLSATWSGIAYRDALKKPYFYLIAGMVLLSGISLASTESISSTYLEDIGMIPQFIATTATVAAVILTFSKILVGTIYDKKGLRLAMLICQISSICSFVLQATLTNSPSGQVFAMIAVVLNSIALPLKTILIPLITNDLFGQASYGKVLGILMSMNYAGMCVGAPFGELFYSLFQTYVPAFWTYAGIMLAVTICFQFVLNRAYKEKAKVLAEESV